MKHVISEQEFAAGVLNVLLRNKWKTNVNTSLTAYRNAFDKHQLLCYWRRYAYTQPPRY